MQIAASTSIQYTMVALLLLFSLLFTLRFFPITGLLCEGFYLPGGQWPLGLHIVHEQ